MEVAVEVEQGILSRGISGEKGGKRGGRTRLECLCLGGRNINFVRYVVLYLFRTRVPVGSGFLVCELPEGRLLACLSGTRREQGVYSFD